MPDAVDWRAALQARWECRHGRPLSWAKLFFKVQDKVTGAAVPYVPMPNQERIDALTFSRFNLLAGQGFDFSAWKPRKAFTTTGIEYGWIALSMVNEGLVGLDVSDSDDTNKSVLGMWDTVDNNLPDILYEVPQGATWTRPGCGRQGCPVCGRYYETGTTLTFNLGLRVPRPRRGLWNTEQRGYEFGEEVGGVFKKRADSYTLFSSYKTTSFGRSFTPVFIHCLEYAHAASEDAPKFNQAIDGSRPAGRSARFNESTGNGPETMHAHDHKAWKTGDTGLVGLVLYWYQDTTNRLAQDSSFVIKADQGDFPFTPEELNVQALPDFPQGLDPVLLHDMFRWRRYELRKALQNARSIGGGEDMADAIFHQEHMEREQDIYAAPSAISPFTKEERERLERGIRRPLGNSEGDFLAARFKWKQFYAREPGHRYILTMDPSKTGATDPCVMKLFDAENDTEVARFAGGVHPKLALESALRVCKQHYAADGPEGRFQDIWFVWERNTVGNDLRDYAHDLGFPEWQCWLDPRERERTNAERQYGWLNGPISRGELLRALVLRVKEGRLRLSDAQSVSDLLNYDFDGNYNQAIDHLPDGVVCDGLYAWTKDSLCPTRAPQAQGRPSRPHRVPVAAGSGRAFASSVWGR